MSAKKTNNDLDIFARIAVDEISGDQTVAAAIRKERLWVNELKAEIQERVSRIQEAGLLTAIETLEVQGEVTEKRKEVVEAGVQQSRVVGYASSVRIWAVKRERDNSYNSSDNETHLNLYGRAPARLRKFDLGNWRMALTMQCAAAFGMKNAVKNKIGDEMVIKLALLEAKWAKEAKKGVPQSLQAWIEKAEIAKNCAAPNEQAKPQTPRV